jgi:hypothetical protein
MMDLDHDHGRRCWSVNRTMEVNLKASVRDDESEMTRRRAGRGVDSRTDG